MTGHYQPSSGTGRCGAILLCLAGLLFTGCPSVPDNGHRAYNPIAGISSKLSGNSQDEGLRKKVDADKFPTAQQAGISR